MSRKFYITQNIYVGVPELAACACCA